MLLQKPVFRGFGACLKRVLFACVSFMIFVFGGINFAHADETYPFSITTTTLPSGNNTFTFKMSAEGTFYVDCGTDGTLSGTIGVSGNTITRTTTGYSSYACSYTSGGVKTIRFGGTAVAYSPDTLYPAISFMNNHRIASLSGDLSALFPVSDNNIPTFNQTFYGCTSLTSIPSTLFSFGGNDVPAQEEMFFGTFAECTGLKSIPSGLFSHIVSGASYAFATTFMGCSGLGTDSDVVAIPADLFSFGGNDVSGETGMFSQTFEGCEGLKSIPSGLFSHVISSAEAMFSSTFADCANLGTDSDVVAIPNDLFSFGGNNVSGQDEMFMSTFVNCTGLKSIPSGLFSHVTSGAVDMFNRTFAGCEGLNGNGDSNQNFIPPSLFEGLINESNPSQSPYETDMMDYIFYDTTLRTRCPENYYQFITGYEDYWDGHVSCKPCPEGKTSSEGSTSIDQCIEPEEIDDPKTPAEITYPFSITTTELSDKNFQFRIFAAGTFYVDCGTGGTLTSDASPSDISGNSEGGFIINRSNVGASSENRGKVYTCSYSDTNSKTIQFGGQATGYFSDFQVIGFNITAPSLTEGRDANVKKISSISGSLGQIFGTIENPTTGYSGQPKFSRTFSWAINMTGTTESISDPNNSGMNYALPPTLFSGISGDPAIGMFMQTFHGCSGLTGTIPSTLFSGISGDPAEGMFEQTFYGCSGLTGSIPSTLFSGISGDPAKDMFDSTFFGCSGLTGSIPSTLFSGISGDPAEGMFAFTFNGCSSLTGSIPSGLFGNIDGDPAKQMFYYTFSGCSGLTGTNIPDEDNQDKKYAIPPTLFGNLTGAPAERMFSTTFGGCSNLTGTIPPTLFGNLTGAPAEYMFYYTFGGCSGLTGSIPSGLFGNIDGTPAKNMFNATFRGCSNLTEFGDTTYVPWTFLNTITDNNEIQNQATDMFFGTPLNKPCPADTYDVTRDQFNDAGRPWCKPCPPDTHSPDGSDGPEDCVAGNILTYNCGIATGDSWSDGNPYTAGALVPMPETINEHCNASDLGRIFTGWICNDNIVPDSNNQIVMPGEPVTCVARWDECDTVNSYYWSNETEQCEPGYEITLDNHFECFEWDTAPIPNKLYTIKNNGVYIDAGRTQKMEPQIDGEGGQYPIQLPTATFVFVRDTQTNIPTNPDPFGEAYDVSVLDNLNVSAVCTGFGPNAEQKQIDLNGYITEFASNSAINYDDNNTWGANWRCSSQSLGNVPEIVGYIGRWYDNVNGDGNAVTQTICDFNYLGTNPECSKEDIVYAKWMPKHYSVTYTDGSTNYVDAYDSETGEGGATFDAPYEALSLSDTGIVPADGYVFAGWTMDPEPQFEDGVLQNEFTGYEYWKNVDNLTVYAAYTCADGYSLNKNGECEKTRTVTYDCNNGKASQTVSYINGQTVIPDITCDVPGDNDEYEFAGWYCSYGTGYITLSIADSGDYGVTNAHENFVYWSGMPGDGFNIEQDVECIAIWQKKRIECPNYGYQWKYVLNAPVDTQLADDYIDTNVSSYDYGSANDFTMNFTYGIVYAYSSCNTTQGVPGLVGEPDKNSYGNHCWCQVRAMSGSSNISFGDDIATWIYLESEDSCSETCRERCEEEAAKTSKGWLGDNDMSFREILYTHDLCNYRIDYDCGDGVVSNINVVTGLNYELSTPASVCQIPTGYVVDEDGDDVIGGGWICNAEHANSFENQRLGIPDVLGNNGDVWTSYDNYMCQIQLECDTDNGYYPKNGVCVNDYGITYTSSIPAGVTVNGMPDPLTVEVPAGTEYTLAPLPTATGYNITGWDCGSNVTVSANNTITMPSTGITCSLVWGCDTANGYRLVNGKCSNTYSVVYSCGDASGGAPTTNTYAVYGGQFTPANNTCDVPNGAVFNGWKVSGTNDIRNGRFTWNYTEDKIFTAVWECDSVRGYQWNLAHDACVFVCDTGKWLHIGNEKMCLYDYKPSFPALAVQIQEETYYLRMESGIEDLKINDHSNKKFKIERDGTIYNVSDVSTKVVEVVSVPETK